MTDEDATAYGHLIREAIMAAEDHIKPDIVIEVDPRDGTKAIFAASKGELKPVAPSAFDPWRMNPVARKGTAELTTLDSFIAHALRFKQGNSVIFARDDMSAARLTAVFDYHPAVSADQDEARNCAHKAEYAFPFSDEWMAWHGANCKPMAMQDFAAFLEDRIVDVVDDAKPSSEAAQAFMKAVGGKLATPTRLVELARGLQVYENSILKEARNLSTGEGQLTFESQHVDADGKPLSVPNLFMVAIPIFARAPDAYRLLARLRYRKAPSGVVFWFELWRADLAFEQAFSEACAKVEADTGMPLFVGAPETST